MGMKKKKFILITAAVLLIITLSSVSAEENTFERFPKALGAQVGYLSGLGLSYQNWGETFGYQVAAGVMAYPDYSTGAEPLLYNAGLEFQYPVYTDSFGTWLTGRLYLVAGARHRGYIEAVYNSGSDTYEKSPFTVEFAVGGGIGVEGVFFDHFAVVTEMVDSVVWKSGESSLTDSIQVILQPQISLRYRF